MTLVVDPTGDRPKLVGSRWVRRSPVGDLWDGPIEVAGIFDLGPDAGGLELVVRLVEFAHGEPALTTTAEALGAHYKREGEPDDGAAGRAQEALQALAATVGAS